MISATIIVAVVAVVVVVVVVAVVVVAVVIVASLYCVAFHDDPGMTLMVAVMMTI